MKSSKIGTDAPAGLVAAGTGFLHYDATAPSLLLALASVASGARRAGPFAKMAFMSSPTQAHVDLSPPSTIHLPPAERVRVWLDLMELTDQLFLAGLRHRIGPDGDLREAVRKWYREDREDREQRDADIAHFMKRLHQRDKVRPDDG